MIRFLSHQKIDRDKWDKCINNSSNALVYVLSWYLDIVSPGWAALVEDNYKSVFPVAYNRKYGISYIRQPHFTQQLGVFAPDSISAGLLRVYLDTLSSQFKFIEMNLNTANNFTSKDFKIAERLTHHLSLQPDYESLRKHYSENSIRNIAKAHKSGVTLDLDADANRVIKLFRDNKGKDIASLKAEDYRVLQSIVKEGRKRKYDQSHWRQNK